MAVSLYQSDDYIQTQAPEKYFQEIGLKQDIHTQVAANQKAQACQQAGIGPASEGKDRFAYKYHVGSTK